MVAERPSLSEVQRVILERMRAGRTLHVEDVAASLYISKSTLQRTLLDLGMRFNRVRRQLQVEVALERLTAGESCAQAAAYVGLSGDHLCKLVTEHADLTPRQIARACQLADRARRWRRSVPPRSDTKLYIKQLERWKAIDAELGSLIDGLSAGHPLAGWAHKLRRATRRPDYRRGRYRVTAQAKRRRERAQLLAQLREAVDACSPQWQDQHENWRRGGKPGLTEGAESYVR